MIGHWVRRSGKQKWHRVESMVAGDAITKCGRRLSSWGEVSEVQPLTRMIGQPHLCRYCDR
jgi:hypothetical protein